jgi:hypothetical protein
LCSFREGKDGEQDQNPKNPNVTRGIGMEAGDHSFRRKTIMEKEYVRKDLQ